MTGGEELQVDYTSIEKSLSELWRHEQHDGEPAVRAALWNVVGHTWSSEDHVRTTEVLARTAASVPQRTIVVRAEPTEKPGMSSWISANCHLIGGAQQVCSEEVSIVAAGDHIARVPPLVKALLLPDMPVAVWWVGDLPDEHHEYVDALLEPADRLIVDSSRFNSASDLELVRNIADQTSTSPADLNWARLEEWRVATAALFEPAAMRPRLHGIARVRVMSGAGTRLGDLSEAILYVAWLDAQLGAELPFELVEEGTEPGIGAVEIHFNDCSIALIRSDRDRGVVIANSDGTETALDNITRTLARNVDDLIVRLLKRPESDRVYLRSLPIARDLAMRVLSP